MRISPFFLMLPLLPAGTVALAADQAPTTTLTAPAKAAAGTMSVTKPVATPAPASGGSTAASQPPASPEHQMRTIAECASRIPASYGQKLQECKSCVARPVPYVYWEEYPLGNRCARDVGMYHP